MHVPFPDTSRAHVEAGLAGWYDARSDLVHAMGLAVMEGQHDEASRLREVIRQIDGLVGEARALFNIEDHPEHPHG